MKMELGLSEFEKKFGTMKVSGTFSRKQEITNCRKSMCLDRLRDRDKIKIQH